MTLQRHVDNAAQVEMELRDRIAELDRRFFRIEVGMVVIAGLELVQIASANEPGLSHLFRALFP